MPLTEKLNHLASIIDKYVKQTIKNGGNDVGSLLRRSLSAFVKNCIGITSSMVKGDITRKTFVSFNLMLKSYGLTYDSEIC